LRTLSEQDDAVRACASATQGTEEYRKARFTSSGSYGLKRELIRIIGNMAYNNTATQNEVWASQMCLCYC
jgi:hypothetical protein